MVGTIEKAVKRWTEGDTSKWSKKYESALRGYPGQPLAGEKYPFELLNGVTPRLTLQEAGMEAIPGGQSRVMQVLALEGT